MNTPLRLTLSEDGDDDPPSVSDRTPDPEVGRLIDALTRQLEQGGRIDEAAVLAAHPEHAETLRRLLPALVLLADLGCSVVSGTLGRDRPAIRLEEGEQFGRFRLLRELGRGGMGVVYEASQAQVSRPVAIKMILAGEFAADAELRRFRAEAEAVSRLDHPNIVPVYEVGEERGLPYFSMKYCPGGGLDDHFERFRGNPQAAARAVAKVARAVHHAHRRGILHRDLKPSNILLDAEGEPMVADFGLARDLDAEQSLTRTGDLIGSPPYMAPEQAASDRGDVTIATDIYGLGAVLYALLTGRPPFRGATPLETLEQVRNRPPDPPSSPDGPVDRDLRTVCLKCLEKDPRDRYESAAELADDLDRWLRGEPIVARPASLGHRFSLWARRPDRVRDAGRYALGIGLMLTLYAASGLLLLALGKIPAPRPEGFAWFLLKWIGLAYGPTAVVGWATLWGYRRVIPLGIGLGLSLFLFFVGFQIGFFRIDAGGAYTWDDQALSVAYHTFFTVIFLTLTVLYGLAFVADRSRVVAKRAESAARTPRLLLDPPLEPETEDD
ncbi:serine/threonine-protein kinase [Tautonia marina]|uniref:serine/threonine-protein kinase n=1 Tax=Tautonia marina TaxID=2653855 RepID=UPI001260A93A|nr:serine/threonine-protein kinase [Tautonia marina]